MRRLLLPLVIASASAVGLAGCGSGSPGRTPTVSIRQAAAVTRQVQSMQATGHMSVTLRNFTAPGTSTPVSTNLVIDMAMTTRLRPFSGRIQMNSMQVNGQAFPYAFTALLTPSAMYMKIPVPQLGGKWLEVPFSALQKMSRLNFGQLLQQAQQMSPSQYLQLLLSAGHIAKDGTAVVNGMQTTHYTGTVDPRTVYAKLAPSLRTQLQTQLAGAGVTSEHIDVWVDADNLPRRVVVSADGTHMSVSARMDYTAYDVPVTVTPPPAADTVNITNLPGFGAAA